MSDVEVSPFWLARRIAATRRTSDALAELVALKDAGEVDDAAWQEARDALAQAKPEIPVDWGIRAQAAAEEHLDACWEAYDANTDSPASTLFDGCQTCCVREVLTAAWPVFERSLGIEG